MDDKIVTWRWLKAIIPGSLFLTLAAICLFSSFGLSATAPQWLQLLAREIQAACRDAGTQWMVAVCLLSYLIVFVVLEAKSRVLGLGSKVGEQETERPTSNAQRPTSKETEVRHLTPALSPNEAERVFPPSSILHPPSSSRPRAISYLLTSISSPDFWLIGFAGLVLFRYALDYANAAKSLQVVVLLTGLVVGKGIALWVGAPPSPKSNVQRPKAKGSGSRHLTPALSPVEAERGAGPSSILYHPSSSRRLTILTILTLLLACAALWHPERGMEFQYRGQPRWTGPWDNPNLFGVLMGVGVVLAVGLLVSDFRFQVSGPKPEPSNLQSSTWRTVYWLKQFFLLAATILCGFGLVKSYSRGAWLGTAVGVGFLFWKWLKQTHLTPALSPRPTGGEGESLPRLDARQLDAVRERSTSNFQPATAAKLSHIWRISRFATWVRLNGFPISVFLISVFVLCFWQFRHTEAPLARRLFSVGNPNDFSWRNRVAAWEGAGRMMGNKPLIGFGWGKAEEVYSKEYRAARLEESAAIQMNDYLMIGISAGTPALACLLGYLLLTGFQVSGFKFQARQAEALELGLKTMDFLPTVCFAGAVVGMVGFWFDGGLFKLPTCVVFWVLVELARGSRRGGEAVAALASDEQNCRAALLCRPAEQQLGPTELQGASVRASRLVGSLAPPIQCGAQRTARPTIALRWLAGITALGALGLTTLHLGTLQFAVSERTLSIARKFLVPPGERNDFEFLAAKNIWANTPLKTLLQHAHLANYNRTLVNWKLEDQLYREFVLSPEINFQPSTPNPQPSDDFGWRRALWEYFYPRIRKESSLEAAAEIVVRHLNARGGNSGAAGGRWLRRVLERNRMERDFASVGSRQGDQVGRALCAVSRGKIQVRVGG
jgi:hypothetical protein